MDVVTDGFGFMLVYGDYCWLPFVYSLQARYLAFNPVELGLGWVMFIVAVQCLGYWIFRSSNGEKNDFRNGKNSKSEFGTLCCLTSVANPSLCLPSDLTFMETKRGTKLLTSGWWGMSRHPNYM